MTVAKLMIPAVIHSIEPRRPLALHTIGRNIFRHSEKSRPGARLRFVLYGPYGNRVNTLSLYAVPGMMLKGYYKDERLVEAGCDEAGRGCLAGPLFAASVILPADFSHPLLNDSKKMSERNRYLMREIIVREAVAWAVAEVSPQEIDRINILNASFEAMSRAVASMDAKPQLLLIDGNRFRTTLSIPFQCIVGGDGLYNSIAAASVLAKTFRDDLMKRLHREFPLYGWDKNKGYPTKAHRLAIMEHGLTPYHRLTFNSPCQLNLF